MELAEGLVAINFMYTQLDERLRLCYECKGASEGRRENYNYSECGLKNVVLKGVMVYRCARCGSARVEIPNMDGLHRTIALLVLSKSSLLSSDEIRFLRTVAGYTSVQFAKVIGVTKNALSRWENNHKIGVQSERSIRNACGLLIIEEALADASSGPVSLDKIKSTLANIKKSLQSEPGKSPAGSCDSQCSDSEELIIDTEFPFSVSIVSPLLTPAYLQ